MNDVNRQAAKNAVRDELKRNPTMAIRAMNAIDNLPSAQPEIIRCKDCTRYEKKRGCNLVEGLNVATAECFCSYAERREE